LTTGIRPNPHGVKSQRTGWEDGLERFRCILARPSSFTTSSTPTLQKERRHTANESAQQSRGIVVLDCESGG
jgi:hypothetical protein